MGSSQHRYKASHVFPLCLHLTPVKYGDMIDVEDDKPNDAS